jgi:hypothetical protein
VKENSKRPEFNPSLADGTYNDSETAGKKHHPKRTAMN